MIKMNYIRCPLHSYTFRSKPIKHWVEEQCEGLTLNLFAGETRLNLLKGREVRNDINQELNNEYKQDCLTFIKEWTGDMFDTILLDPPYSLRKSMEFYQGRQISHFTRLLDLLPMIMKSKGIVITFGYQSVIMGTGRGFEVERICLFNHSGAQHDTIATVERRQLCL